MTDCVKWAFWIVELNQIDTHIVAHGINLPANIASFSPKEMKLVLTPAALTSSKLPVLDSFTTQHTIPNYLPSPLHLCLCIRQEHVLRLSETKYQESPGTRWHLTLLSEGLRWPTGSRLHTDLKQITQFVFKSHLLQILNNPTYPIRFHDRDDDYRPASFTPVISVLQKKVVVVAHWKHFTGPLLDPLLLAPRALTSVNEAVIMHSILQHLLQRVIALYAPFSAQLTDSIRLLPTSLKDRMQQGRLWKFIFCSGIPQGCVFASLLFFLQHKWLHLWGHQSFLRLPTPLPSPYSTLWPQWKIAGLWLNYV